MVGTRKEVKWHPGEKDRLELRSAEQAPGWSCPEKVPKAEAENPTGKKPNGAAYRTVRL
jgi:hypothetical protein